MEDFFVARQISDSCDIGADSPKVLLDDEKVIIW